LKELGDLWIISKIKRGSSKFEQTCKHEYKRLEEAEESDDIFEAFLEQCHLIRNRRVHFEHSEDLDR